VLSSRAVCHQQDSGLVAVQALLHDHAYQQQVAGHAQEEYEQEEDDGGNPAARVGRDNSVHAPHELSGGVPAQVFIQAAEVHSGSHFVLELAGVGATS